MSTEETQIEPLFAHDIPGPQLTAKDLARALSKGGVPHSAASARVQSYIKNRWVMARARKSDAPNSPNVFSIPDVFAAKVLSGLHDAGVADHEVMSRASNACYFFNLAHYRTVPKSGSPIAHAADGVIFRREEWIFRADFWRNPQTDERHVNAWLAPDNQGRRWNGWTPDWVPMSSITMILEPHFTPLTYLFGVPKGLN